MPRTRGDILCFSQLRWDFVYQRPHHLMTRAARHARVWYVEEPVFEDDGPQLIVAERRAGLVVLRPVIPPGWPEDDVDRAVSLLLREFVANRDIERPIAWYYTPMALAWTGWLHPGLTVYDCMDELSAFRFASPRLVGLEGQLLARADLVFTGGRSLYEAKRMRHPNVHAFPSAVDLAHFAVARIRARDRVDPGVDQDPANRDRAGQDPADQRDLGSPRVGWFGVIDERTDLDLLGNIADLRPTWSYVLIGPTVKIDPGTIPVRPNLHLLGPREYDELPRYIAGWDVAIMPFARNASTRFISPTKTLEYLAAGRPIVSTSIRDVVEPFERLGLVRIADTPKDFVSAIELAIAQPVEPFIAAADAFLKGRGWDETFERMWTLVSEAHARRVAEARSGSRGDQGVPVGGVSTIRREG